MKQAFGEQKRISKKRRELIEQIDAIASDYSQRGMKLTVRQCYYQLVSKGIIPNGAKEYGKVVDAVADGRLAGLLDWEAFEDRGRYVRENAHWNSPREIIEAAARQYKIDIRQTQPYYSEAWIEKDSLVSILEDICLPLDVPCFSCRGFSSVTALYEASERIKADGRPSIILYCGDHDPSGLRIAQNIAESLSQTFELTHLTFRRIGITPEQVQTMNLPPFPAKKKDKNYDWYVKTTGLTEAWEVDALPPEVLKKLYTDAISEYTDFTELARMREREKADKSYFSDLVA